MHGETVKFAKLLHVFR